MTIDNENRKNNGIKSKDLYQLRFILKDILDYSSREFGEIFH